ncbi:MAG: radical SAM protein [Deltaproteobacteria bacterium]|nr:radical SAM protein [Deltaproteobacteria bacterium]
MSSQNRVTLSRDCALKRLETPAVYHIKRDELYELDQEAFDFLLGCYSPRGAEGIDQTFLDFCLKEGILVSPAPSSSSGKCGGRNSPPPVNPSPRPSLRYLELLLTERCNLRCSHCYLGDAGTKDLAFERVVRVMDEFERVQGLRLLLSGGEPLLHRDFWRINELLPGYNFRTVLLTNGTLIDNREWRVESGETRFSTLNSQVLKGVSQRLNVHEVQISLDGMEASHDVIRGKGSFKKALRAIECLKEAWIDISIATMVTSYNRGDFTEMKKLLEGFDIKAWTIDIPCLAGNLLEDPSLLIPYNKAIKYLDYAYGGGNHGSSPGYACGSHLCAVTSDGVVCRCGFFRGEVAGSIEDGLEVCWNRIKHYTLDELECSCPHRDICRGGCRFRALTHTGSIFAPDPLYCRAYGVTTDRQLVSLPA